MNGLEVAFVPDDFLIDVFASSKSKMRLELFNWFLSDNGCGMPDDQVGLNSLGNLGNKWPRNLISDLYDLVYLLPTTYSLTNYLLFSYKTSQRDMWEGKNEKFLFSWPNRDKDVLRPICHGMPSQSLANSNHQIANTGWSLSVWSVLGPKFFKCVPEVKWSAWRWWGRNERTNPHQVHWDRIVIKTSSVPNFPYSRLTILD